MKEILLDLNYNSSVDIITILLCCMLLVLLRKVFIKNKRLFILMISAMLFILSSSLANILCNFLIDNGVNNALIYITKHWYYCSNIIIMFMYVFYVNYLSNYNEIKITHILYFDLLVTIVCVIMQLITPLTHFGFYKSTNNIFVSTSITPFGLVYIIDVCIMLYLLRHYKNAMVMTLHNMLVLILLVCVFIAWFTLGIMRCTTYLNITFLIPIIVLIFLQHSNPYDYDTGALDYNSLEVFLRENSGKSFYYLGIKFFIDKEDIPMGLKKALMNFYYADFSDSLLFNINDNMFILVIDTTIPNAELKIRNLLTQKFDTYFKKYKLSYKVQVVDSTNEFTDFKTYKFVLRQVIEQQAINSMRFLHNDEIRELKKGLLLIDILKDIEAQRNFNDPRVVVYCQPVKNIKTNTYDRAEVLMRLKIDDMGLITPNYFIPLAEQYNLIHSLSMIILNKTCKEIVNLEEQGYILERISVNFSPMELKQDTFVSDVIDIIDTIGIAHNKIAIEVTESVTDFDYDVMLLRIRQLRDAHIQFYLDDFGTGYSNIDRMLRLQLNVIKFDKSLMYYAFEDVSTSFVLKSFIDLFNNLGYDTLIEGVETEAQEQFCIDSGVDFLQGYLYAKPLPLKDLKKYLIKKSS